ncbi:MAG: S41 family peptidase [Candidatus Kapaibacterium sp.]|nr:MAG: S41 family peptidase [Candidatus Kapabacteria bacterium]
MNFLSHFRFRASRRFRVLGIACAVVLLAASAYGFRAVSDNPMYIKISKSLGIFGEFFRQVSNDYVDEIDPLEFVEAGIEGMVKHLDPYTTYISDEDSEEVDIITTGVYGGLGITTALIDSNVTIVGITEGCAAEKAGLRVGDRIYSLDSTVVLNATTNDLRKHTRGKPGSSVPVRVLRSGVRDTLSFVVVRQEVTLKNVTFHGLIPASQEASAGSAKSGALGYVRLERFTTGAANEVREALEQLRKQAGTEKKELQGWVLDVRENPGGLLDAAVGICELFVPSGTLIVATRGRSNDSERRYVSRRPPLEPALPLAVLISENTASASEIVAGALQDLDRAVIIGERSFGKGLVQTISALPYDATLKMTTAKYYTPSGRCIQKIDYNQRRHGIVKSQSDTSKTFRTSTGRIVRDASGILPDTVMLAQVQTDIVEELFRKNVLFQFANEFSGSRKTLPDDFSVDKRVVEQFYAFAKRSKFVYESPAYRKLLEIERLQQIQPLSSAVAAHIASAKQQLAKEQTQELEKQRETITDALHEEILERFYPRSTVIGKTLSTDGDIETARSLLVNPKRYKALLRQVQ